VPAWRKGARGLPANRPKNGEDRACEVCGKTFYVPAGMRHVRRCSPECYHKARWGGRRRVVKDCRGCGKPFESYVSDGKAVCSRACDSTRKSIEQSGESSVLWRGGRTNPYVGTWKRQRRLARERDGGTCRLCGSGDRPQVHHIVPARYGGTHDLGNLITLCRSCHSREELKVNAMYRGVLERGRLERLRRIAERKAEATLDAA
jgi:5-methylcytosine-specific restriction endonuclease McrA